MNKISKNKIHPYSLAREFAIQFLYQAEVNKRITFEQQEFETFVNYFNVPEESKDFLYKLAYNAFKNLYYIDSLISETSKNWALYRITITDKSILRIAIAEFICADTPTKVVIDEAIELAKKYGTEKSYKFINGILDKVAEKLNKISVWPDN